MKLICLIMLLGLSSLHAKVWSQTEQLELSVTNASLIEALKQLQQKTNLKFVYNYEEVQNFQVNVRIKGKTLRGTLDILLTDKPLTYEITTEHVIISKALQQQNRPPKMIEITGVVVDENGSPLPGVTVMLKGTALGTATDVAGNFKLQIPENNVPSIFLCSFIGMRNKEVILVKGQVNYKVILEEEAQKLEDVVVTGYFQRNKISQTGSEVVVTGEELRKVGSLNLLQAISSFDPSVRTIENNEFGSDPNRVPEITVRGEKGFDLRDEADDSRTNPNAPLYIMDGIEVSATIVYDMDMNRIASFSILKDAAATSIYGSRGANGVIVITTVRPEAGQIRVSINANYNVSIPDLRSYNLMDAREKLEYERLAKLYTNLHDNKEEQTVLDIRYNRILAEIERGVNTYWLSQPLQTSVNQRYSAYLEGGDDNFRYGLNFKYDTDKGVMIGSGREKYGANIYFSYNLENKFIARNDLTIDDVKGRDSHYGAFSQYAKMNPFERLEDPETGEMIRSFNSNGTVIRNPLINAYLPNNSFNKYTEIRDNLQLQWWATSRLYLKGNIALTKKIERDEAFLSAESTDFEGITDVNQKGSYTALNSTGINVEGNLTASYNQIILEKLSVSLGAGGEFITLNSYADGYSATGFLNNKLTHPSYAQQFRQNGKPSGNFDKSKSVSFLANINIGWDNRYITEFSFRTDGSSRFGRNSRFAPFWATSIAWNVNREKFWNGSGSLKVRASVGSTGATNFSADQALTRFVYNSDSEYNGTYGAVISAYGNPSLKWQNVLKYNIGLDMSVWKNIIVLNFDAYLERTENLLLNIDVAPSTGFSSYKENMGSIDNKGFEARLRLNLINNQERDLNWNITLSTSHEKNKIRKLSNAMDAMNKEALDLKKAENVIVPRMYEVGRSQNALMVVHSLGIDPITGNEIYQKLNGSLTYDYDPEDKVEVGNVIPKFKGFFNSSVSWKGMNLYLAFRYEYGAKAYNSTLASKVEGADPKYNADKRVLYDRWKKPGDVAMFRRIDAKSSVYQSSRLVQDNNFLSLSSLSFSYDLPRKLLNRTFFERCKFIFSATDVFRISTIKQERGTSYPFAKTFSAGVNVTF